MAEERDEQLVEVCLKGQGGRRSDGHDGVVLAGAPVSGGCFGRGRAPHGALPAIRPSPADQSSRARRRWAEMADREPAGHFRRLLVPIAVCCVTILLSTPNYCVARSFSCRANRPFPPSDNPQLRCPECARLVAGLRRAPSAVARSKHGFAALPSSPSSAWFGERA